MKKYKVFEMLKRSQNLKYRLAINSLIVGILVGSNYCSTQNNYK